MTPPRPGLSLTICSLAALFLSAVLCAICTGAMLHASGSQVLGLGLGSLLLLPGFLGLGLTQYAGTFQGKAAKAELVARLYSFGSGFMLIALVCVLLDIAGSGHHPSWPVMAVGGGFAVFAAWGRIGGRLNREWAVQLRQFEEEQGTDSELPARRGHPLVWIASCVVFLAATGAVYWALSPQTGEHVKPNATPLLLPEGASDVCYWIYAGNTAFEFSISEPDFLAWAETEIKSRQSDFGGMKKVTEPETVPTYRAWLPGAPPPHEAVVEEGYCYAWQQGGKRVQYAYDQRTSRAYYAACQPNLK